MAANNSEFNIGGRSGIRTHEGADPLPVFKTGALNHSAILPWGGPSKAGKPAM
jgi:hypothetical protein